MPPHSLSVGIYFYGTISWKFLFSITLVSNLKKSLKRIKNFRIKLRANKSGVGVGVRWEGRGNPHSLATKDPDAMATEIKIHFDVFQIRLLLSLR